MATGMADARTALWDDASSLFYNPAAITQLRGFHLTLGDTLIFPSIKYTPLPEDQREDPVLDGQNATDGEFKLFYPMHFYFTAQATKWLTVGLSLDNRFGLGTYWPEDWDGRFTAWQTEIRTFWFQPVLAVSLARLARLPRDVELSVAVGADFVYGDAVIHQKVDLSNFGAVAGVPDAEADMIMEGDAHGFGANWAFFAAWKPWFSLGGSIRSGVRMPFSGEASFKNIPDEVNQVLQNPPYGIIFPESTTGTAVIDLPMHMNFGVAFHGLKKFTFAVDFYVAMWETYDELKVVFDCSTTGECYSGLNADAVYPKNWKTGYQVSIGGEYRPIKQVAVRLGYGYVTNPTDPEYYDAMLPDGNRHLVTAGIGYRAPRFFKVDLGYMLAMWQGKKENDVGKPSATGPNGKANGTYKTMSHLLAISLGFNFGGLSKGKPMTMDQ
jgi:long-chain fatty acid transport protein